MLVLCPRSDIAGTGIAIKRAFRYSDIEVRQVRRVPKAYAYPYDAEWDQRQALIEWSDVVHVMELPGAIPRGKRSVLHHHGTYARSHLRELLRVKTTHICSTLDLHLLGLGEWIPTPYDGEWLRTVRRPSDVLTIAHAPTNRAIKSTAAFEAACDRLEKLVPIRRLVIENQPWTECLRLKGQADIYFDQTGLGYGNNAVEAWGMGIPVIAGASDETLVAMEQRFPIPFYEATESTLYHALLDLASSQVKRDYWGRRGAEHFARFHDERVVVKQLADIYRRA